MTASIAFLSQKGGAGKTTLSVHTAVAAQQAGEQVLLIDTDPQGSAAAWYMTRGGAPGPMLAKADAARIHAHTRTCTHAHTLYVVDCAPHAGPDAVTIARNVDLVLIPVRPSAFDLAAARQTVDIVRKAGTRAAFVLSACPFRAPEIEEARAVLAEHGFPVLPVAITERRAFQRAITTGQAVSEFEPLGKAAIEIAVLWRRIRAYLGTPNGETPWRS